MRSGPQAGTPGDACNATLSGGTAREPLDMGGRAGAAARRGGRAGAAARRERSRVNNLAPPCRPSLVLAG